MNFIYLKEVDSTQKYLIRKIKEFKTPVCVWSEMQTAGIGSRGSGWIGKKGNLFFSFAFEKSEFESVPLQSMSIYFGWLFKKTLNTLGSSVVMKWPNDIYLLNEKPLKIGGVITNVLKEHLICGIGLNTLFAPKEGFGCLDIRIKNDKILKKYFEILQSKPAWDEVIEKYKKEFEKTKKIFSIEGVLDVDGAIVKNNKKVYSKR